jgi:hypothetical protein
MGLDFVTVVGPDGTLRPRTVVVGAPHTVDGRALVEILSGLEGDEQLVTDSE